MADADIIAMTNKTTPLVMLGKPVAEALGRQISTKIAVAANKGQKPALAILTVGDDPASHVYKNRLIKLAKSLGADAFSEELPPSASLAEVILKIDKLNCDKHVTAVLPMQPMPPQIDAAAVSALLAPHKDVDCQHPFNAGQLFLGEGMRAPCTPRACLEVLKYYGIELAGKHVVVIGRSNIVGKPAALLFLQQNATVTVCHSKTQNLPALLRTADIIVAAVGRARFVKADMVKDGVVLVDVGTNVVDDKLVGDIDEAAYTKASAYTPVPGGVGVVSNMMVMDMLSANL